MAPNETALDECRGAVTDRMKSVRGLSEILQAEIHSSLNEDQAQALDLLFTSLRNLQNNLGSLRRAARMGAGLP